MKTHKLYIMICIMLGIFFCVAIHSVDAITTEYIVDYDGFTFAEGGEWGEVYNSPEGAQDWDSAYFECMGAKVGDRNFEITRSHLSWDLSDFNDSDIIDSIELCLYAYSGGYGDTDEIDVSLNAEAWTQEPDDYNIENFLDVVGTFGHTGGWINTTLNIDDFSNDLYLGLEHYPNSESEEPTTINYLLFRSNDVSGYEPRLKITYHRPVPLETPRDGESGDYWDMVSTCKNYTDYTDLNFTNDVIVKSWDDAVNDGWILHWIYGWDITVYYLVGEYGFDDSVNASQGYWMWFYEDCHIVINCSSSSGEFNLDENIKIILCPMILILGLFFGTRKKEKKE